MHLAHSRIAALGVVQAQHFSRLFSKTTMTHQYRGTYNMAFYVDTHSREAGLGARIAANFADLMNSVAKHMARRNVARTTYNELASLSNAELADLGIARAQIRGIALETARNAV